VYYKFAHSILRALNLYIVHQKRATAMIIRKVEVLFYPLNCCWGQQAARFAAGEM
jgi:hypothetical protein